MTKVILNVSGMSCSHCENAIKNALTELAGVSSVAVSLQENQVAVEYDSKDISLEAIKVVITDEGYDVAD